MIDAVGDSVVAVKLQLACFERLGVAGRASLGDVAGHGIAAAAAMAAGMFVMLGYATVLRRGDILRALANPKLLRFVPAGALFRVGDVWAVYRLVDGRARRTLLRLGASNGLEAEVLGASGDPGPGGPLRAGDAVVLYPGEDVEEDVRVAPR